MTREEASYILRKFYADGYKSNNYSNLEQALQLAVCYLENSPRWISVDELPKIGKDVLVLREDGEMQVAHQYNEEIARWWSVDGFPLKNNITHWMPLPSTEEIRGDQGETSPNLSNSSNAGKDLKGGEE